MKERKSIPSNCRFCGYQCGLTATVVEGKIIAVKPDSSRFPYDESVLRSCKRWPMIPQVMDHPQRVNYPLKRAGERGSGQWQKISWDQAMDEIADKLQVLKERFGPEMLATGIGGPHTTYWPLHRFMSLFGSPNNMGIGQICWNPGIWVNTLTYGWPIDMELDPVKTKAAVFWGVNPAESDNSLLWHTILEYREVGNPLVVVDPRRTRTAEQASLWLPVRPGTDPVLALGLLHIVVEERLYDKHFTDCWCHGFEWLEQHLAPYTPAYVEKITGVQADDVITAARLYATNAPATIYSGRGIDQLGPNTFPTHRALAILRAITGNLDVEGASHLSAMPDFIPELDLELGEQYAASRPKHLNQDKLLLQSYEGYQRIRELTMKHHKRLPMRYLTSAHPNLVWHAILTSEPYPVRALIVMGSNPLLTQADTRLIYKALRSLDLLVVLELFQTPTAMLADYILPSAGVMERPLLETKAGVANIAYGGNQAVEPYYDRRSDFYFWKELGIRLGQSKDWPWDTYHQALEASLAPLGLSWEEFCQTGLYGQPHHYGKHEMIESKSSLAAGFATSSGKVEIYSEVLAEMGEDPLPVPKKGPKTNEEFPLLLISGARCQPYYASSFHQIDRFRKMHPAPWAEMSMSTARSLGIEQDFRIWVETERGKAQFVTRIAEMCEGVISVEYGWWYPEMTAAIPALGGLWIGNANLLTSGDYESSDPLIGTWTYNGVPCRVSRV